MSVLVQHQVNLRGKKKHHDTIRDLIAASSHVLSSSSSGGAQWVYGGRLFVKFFVVSARTNKRHHHHHQRWANFSEINPHRAVWRTRAGAKKTFTFVTNSRHFSVGVTATLIVNILVDSRHHQE